MKNLTTALPGITVVLSVLAIILSLSVPGGTSNETFYYKEGHFEFTSPLGWKEKEVSKVKLPEELAGELHFAFKKENADCTLVHMTIPESVRKNYVQTSFVGELVKTRDRTLNPSWYIHTSKAPNLEFQWEGKQELPGEILMEPDPNVVMNEETFTFFGLFNENGGAVQEKCKDDTISLLQSLKERYDEVVLDPNTNGHISLTYSSNFSHLRLLYKKDEASLRKSVMDISLAQEGPRSIVFNNEIYLLHEDEKLYTLDFFDKKFTEFPGIDYSRGVINEFAIIDNRLFYLVGRHCRGYQERCDNSLYEYNMDTKESKLLNSGISSRDINSIQGNRLVMSYSDGDAGCWETDSIIYNLDSGTLESGKSFSGCVWDEETGDNAESKLELAERDAYLGTSNVIETNNLLLKNGKILPGKAEERNSQNEWFRYIN